MNITNILLIGIFSSTITLLVVVVVDYEDTRVSHELLFDEKLQIKKVIEEFEKKYERYTFTVAKDSQGHPRAFYSQTSELDVELIIERDRVIFQCYDKNDNLTIIVNPTPEHVVNACSKPRGI